MAEKFNPSDTARVLLVDEFGVPYKAGGGGGSTEIQVNGVDTADQTILDFVDSATVTFANPSGGQIQATAAGGTGTVTHTGTLTADELIIGNGGVDVKALGSAGTTTTVLHGNAAGAPSFGSVATNDISDAAVTLAKIQNAAASDKLLGSGATGSGSPYAEITLGTNLSMSGTTLNASGSGTTLFSVPGLRLTLTSGVPVTTSDVTAAGTLYYTPYTSGVITYYTGSAWAQESIAEISLALTLTSGKNYDVFYLHGTGLVLSSAWTNDTTRADALGTQDGVTVLASDHTKLWVGTIRASGTNTTEDSTTNRFLYNAFNFARRTWNGANGTGHSFDGIGGQRPWDNNATLIKPQAVFGNPISGELIAWADVTSGGAGVLSVVNGALDGASQTQGITNGTGQRVAASVNIEISINIGYHYLGILENVFGGVACTFNIAQVSMLLFQ